MGNGESVRLLHSTMPLITLTTDYGTVDSYIGEIRGVLLGAVPGVTLVDISHNIAPGDVRSAAYVLGRAWRSFPAGTVHLAVVDPGVGTGQAALAVRAQGHVFVAPDNGLLSGPLGGADVEAIALPTPPGAAPTFHGRDLFAPAAAALAAGRPLQELGSRFTGVPRRLAMAEPHYEGKSIIGEVVHVDRFGNLITNLTPALVPAYARFEVEGLDCGSLRNTFGDVPTGGVVVYLGSAGAIEVAVRDGSAARRLGLGVGGRVTAILG